MKKKLKKKIINQKSDELINIIPEKLNNIIKEPLIPETSKVSETTSSDIVVLENKQELTADIKTFPAEIEKNINVETNLPQTKFKKDFVFEQQNIWTNSSQTEKEVPVLKKDVEKKEIEQKKTKKTRQYYKIIFIQEKKEKQYFTEITPKIIGDTLQIKNAFEKITFSENVLNQKLITDSCKLELDSNICLNLADGLLIKLNKEEDWMNAFKDDVEKIHNEKVLKTYRELSSNIIISSVTKEKSSKLIDL